MERAILLADMNSFFASVHQVLDRSYGESQWRSPEIRSSGTASFCRRVTKPRIAASKLGWS